MIAALFFLFLHFIYCIHQFYQSQYLKFSQKKLSMATIQQFNELLSFKPQC